VVVEVRVSSRNDLVVSPIKRQLASSGWNITESEETLNWTKLTCEVEVDTHGQKVIGDDDVTPYRVPDNAETSGGDGGGGLGLGDKRGPKRESRARKSTGSGRKPSKRS
jgi:hypothetical protein